MALWLVRAGRYGEHMQRFLDTNRLYATWEGVKHDLSKLTSKAALYDLLKEAYPAASDGRLRNWAGQLWPFAREMQPGDWVVVPYKNRPAFNVAEITGPYHYDAAAEDRYNHLRAIKWVARDIPRSVLDQDLLYSLGAIMTICRIARNDAEKRVRVLAAAGWVPSAQLQVPDLGNEDELAGGVDLERLARDQIAGLIIRKFKGHGLARVVEAVLKAQGYTTHRSSEGPDKGIDILAAPGSLGFGEPRVCVQVKSGDTPADLPTLNQLIGAMQNVHAQQGLLVSWGGFKSSVDRETPTQFFRVRLWDQDDLVTELLSHYDRLDEDLRAELPLKRIWTLAVPEDEE